MEIIKKRLTLKELNFNILLSQGIKNLGLSEDISTNINITPVSTQLNGVTENQLGNVRSYDFNNPYQVGVNGVTELTATSITYIMGDVKYVTNLDTKETTFSVNKVENIFSVSNFIRTDDSIGLIDKIQVDNEIDIERSPMSVIESFSKLQSVSAPDEFYNLSNSFYKVYDQTL